MRDDDQQYKIYQALEDISGVAHEIAQQLKYNETALNKIYEEIYIISHHARQYWNPQQPMRTWRFLLVCFLFFIFICVLAN